MKKPLPHVYTTESWCEKIKIYIYIYIYICFVYKGKELDRPNTKWVFQRNLFIDLKVILDRQSLQIGFGRLPDWLRNKHEVMSLDTYNDNLCLFRCIAVYRDAHRRFNTRRARELAQSFRAASPKLPSITLKEFHLLEKHFKQGIAAYSVTIAGDFVLTHTPSHYDKVFDFEAYQVKTKPSNPTRDLSYESEHVPISVSIADTLHYEPEYICSKDPNELIRLFYQSLVQRSIIIRGDVEERYMPEDLESLPVKQQKRIKQWCSQVPVVGINSGRYDLQLIRKYFINHLCEENVSSGEKQGRIMFMNTPQFKFLDVTNYLSPGITYNKWVKTCGAKQTKSWLPYEWFDSADKLDYKGLPSYWCWYSQLKNEFTVTPTEYDECKRVFQVRGMQTFGDWLEYYNNLDVTPFLETLEKMKAYYTNLGVDIFKDAVSLPGVSMQYILRGTLRRRNAPQLYAPGKEAYDSSWRPQLGLHTQTCSRANKD